MPGSTAAADPSAVAAVLNECQKSYSKHNKLGKKLYTAHQALGEQAFRAELINKIQCLLPVFKNEPAVERAVHFVVQYVVKSTPVSGGENSDNTPDAALEPLVCDVLQHLLRYQNAKDKGVRLRVCQIIAMLIGEMGDDAEINEELWDSLYTVFLKRAQDKVPGVRVEALRVLGRLQDPEETDDDVTCELVRLMNNDSSKMVRMEALKNLFISPHTMEHVIERTRDVKEEVRAQAYLALGVQVPAKSLGIAQRIKLLDDGLQDRSEPVKSACVTMLCSHWLEEVGGDPLALLHLLNVEQFEEQAELVVRALIEHANAEANIEVGGLTPEAALYWRVQCAVVGESDAELLADELLPTLADFSDILSRYSGLGNTVSDGTDAAPARVAEDETCAFVVKQLLAIAHMLEFDEEAGRRRMWTVVNKMLRNLHTPGEHVGAAMKLMHAMSHSEDDHIRYAIEMVTTMHDRLEEIHKEMADAGARRDEMEEMLDAMKEEYTQLRGTNPTGARGIKGEMKALQREYQAEEDAIAAGEDGEEAVLVRSLQIVTELLMQTSRDLTNGHLANLLPNVIQPGVRHPNPLVRNEGLRALGHFAFLDVDVARKHLVLLKQIVENDQEGIQFTALSITLDWLLVFGKELCEVHEGDDEGAPIDTRVTNARFRQLVDGLLAFVSHESDNLRTLAVEGFAKLFFTGRLHSTRILSRMVLMYFNPLTEEDVRLRQCLAMFLPAYAMSSREAMALYERAFMPTLRVLFAAPRTSPLRKVNVAKVAQYLLSLTDASTIKHADTRGVEEDSTPHDRLGMAIADEITEDPIGEHVKPLARVLPQLSLRASTQENIKMLRIMAERAQADVEDKMSVKNIQKFEAMLIKLDRTPEDGLDEATCKAIAERTKQFLEGEDGADNEEEDEEDEDEDEDEGVLVSVAADDDEEEDEEDDEEDEEDEEEVVVKAAPKKAKKAPAKRASRRSTRSRVADVATIDMDALMSDSDDE